jgi:hypothetical protein
MTRMRRLLLAATTATLIALGTAGPALAEKGGSPNPDSCGVGREGAQTAIADPTSPGATEFAKFPPSEAGCTGHP